MRMRQLVVAGVLPLLVLLVVTRQVSAQTLSHQAIELVAPAGEAPGYVCVVNLQKPGYGSATSGWFQHQRAQLPPPPEGSQT